MNNMPRKLINNYTFYKIVCLDNSVDLSYVGSTADFNKRKSDHKQNCNVEKRPAHNYKVYKTIRENGGWSNFKIIEIAKQDQLTLRQAEFIEEQYRKELNAEMNDRRCFRTEEERKEQCKEWRENNPEYTQTTEYKSKHAIADKKYAQTETGKASNAAHSKKYRESEHGKASRQTPEFKAKNTLYQKKYRENNKEEIKAKQQTPEYKARHAIADKKYYDKKKLELQKEQLKNNKE